MFHSSSHYYHTNSLLPQLEGGGVRANAVIVAVTLVGKVQPRTDYEGLEGENRYNSTLSSTSALDGEGGQPHTPAASPPGKRRSTHCKENWAGPRTGLDTCG